MECVCACMCVLYICGWCTYVCGRVLCPAGQFQVVVPVQDGSSAGRGGGGFKKQYKLSSKDFLVLEHTILDCPGMHGPQKESHRHFHDLKCLGWSCMCL